MVEISRETVKRLEKQCAVLQEENKQIRADLKEAKERYQLLANSKFGRLTLRYWRFKDLCRAKIKQWGGDRKQSESREVPLKHAPSHTHTHTRACPSALSKPVVFSEGTVPSVTVIVPTYRDNAYIRLCVDSVLRHDYPKEKITVCIVVNGPDREYADKLRQEYEYETKVRVLYTPKKGVGAARNLGVRKADTDCITFLDDDDLFYGNYLKTMAAHIGGEVTLVCGSLCDYDEETGAIDTDTYINKELNQAPTRLHERFLCLKSQLSIVTAKLYLTEQLQKEYEEIDEDLHNTEDVVFWARNYQHISGKVYTCVPSGTCTYLRRVRSGSLSRPSKESLVRFYREDRLTIIDRLGEILIQTPEGDSREFVLGKIKIQGSLMISRCFSDLAPAEQEAFSNCVRSSGALFVNKSHFGLKKGIAFCHNFPPYADPSAYVASRRLSQISDLEGRLVNWHVVRGNMENCRKPDRQYEALFAEFQYTSVAVVGTIASFEEKGQLEWGDMAYRAVKDGEAEVIYSRSMWAGSHVAAYYYKQQHPSAVWYAEFSDPLYMNIENKKRVSSRIYDGKDSWLNGFWGYVENMVYELADHILFVNEQQREYMLRHNPHPEWNKRALAHSMVIPHPVMDHRYCGLVKSGLQFPQEAVNVAFFGSFYKNRRTDELLRVLDNEKVLLHIFSDNASLSETLDQGKKDRIICHPTVPYFEFLNICTLADYLIISDVDFEDKDCVPYLPSKYADYLASGTRILAIPFGNSPLANRSDPQLILLDQNAEDIIANLGK